MPASSVRACSRRACGAPAVVAAPEPRVPRLRRGRVPASATASGVRVVDVPAPLEPRFRTPSRVLAPHERCSRRPSPSSRVLVVRVPRSRRPSSECRASDERAAAPVVRARRWCARVDRAVCSCRWSRRGVLASRVPRPRRACRGARRPCAALWRPRRECRRARARSAAAVCLRRGSRRARAEGAAARAPSAAVPPSIEPRARASVDRAAVPSTRERYAGAVGAVSEWWTCLRRACRIDR